MNKRKILVVTGKRGGWGALIPTLKELQTYDNVETVLVATDQHLYKDFGYTINEVQNWFDIHHLVPMDQDGDRPVDRTKALSRCMDWMSSVFHDEKPDILLILGDRGEILSVVVTAIHFQIPVAHIQGGDVTGNVDEYIRHAITKMSHIHFPSTQKSADRIIKMGENPKSVHVVGDTHLDMIQQGNFTKPEEIYKKYSIDPNRKLILVLQHSNTCSDQSSYKEMKIITQALDSINAQKLYVYPCTDTGYDGIITAIEEARTQKDVQIYSNIECQDFWGLQNVASVFVGNSSAGIIETPIFNLPSVTIGDRQRDRESASNVFRVDDLNEESIRGNVAVAMNIIGIEGLMEDFASNPYGDGTAYKKIAKILSEVELKNLFIKRMTY